MLQGNRFALCVVVPREKNGLRKIVRQMNPQLLNNIANNMQESTVKLKLPKFNFDFTAALVPALQEVRVFIKNKYISSCQNILEKAIVKG